MRAAAGAMRRSSAQFAVASCPRSISSETDELGRSYRQTSDHEPERTVDFQRDRQGSLELLWTR